MGLKPIFRAKLNLSIVPGLVSKDFYRSFGKFLGIDPSVMTYLQKNMTFCLSIGIISLCFSGCVQRRLQIRSQPEGALVSVDRQPVGSTPVSVPYTYHGTREIQLEKDGFKTVRVEQNIRPAWFDRFPVSLISNNFAFREIRDDRVFDFAMEPKEPVNESMLYDRANDMRRNIQRGTLTAPISR